MYGKIFWKLLLTIAIAGWAASNLSPLRETAFPEYARKTATAETETFNELMDRAEEVAANDPEVTEFMALRSIASEEKIDLHRFFPQMRLEESMRNIEKRNNLILNELLKDRQASLQLGLDLRGGVSFTLALAEKEGQSLSSHEKSLMLEKTIEIVRSRADGLGVSEPIIRPVGDSRIEVQLAGVTTADNPDITRELQRPALLEFRLVHRMEDPSALSEEDLPLGYEILHLEQEDRGGEILEIPVLVSRVSEIKGEAVSSARVYSDEIGGYRVGIRFTSEGGRQFGNLTRRIAEENRPGQPLGRLAIVLDGQLYSAPTVENAITGGSAEISGRFSQREAFELANVLNNPLDVPLEIVEMYEVGPTLAADSIVSAKKAMIIGASLVAIFVIAYYLVSGLVACIALAVNVLIIIGVLASIGATLTLPGIAGIVLTIGMAVDANILIFERIREELKIGKSLKSALLGGYEKALSAIVDANLTTLLTAVVLIFLGTGPVKGFGVTLAIGIFTSVFGALVISRFILEFLVEAGLVSDLKMFSLVKDPKFDFLGFRKAAFIAAGILMVVGIAAVIIRGNDIYGIDFVGGDEIRISFSERLDTTDIENIAAENDLGEVIPVYRSPIGGTMEELVIQTEAGQGEAVFAALADAFPGSDLTLAGENFIGPSVGKEIRTNAIIAMGVALIGILLYVAFRFEMGYGIAAVAALLHDVVLAVGIFVLSGKQFTAPMVAGVLMVVGYSINDTIVIFDRIREQLELDPNSKLRDIINLSINNTLSRTLLTSITTFLATASLYIFGGGVVNDFAFIFLLGIIFGTFSSIFIASPVFFWWHKGDRRHVEDRRDVLPNYEWVASSKASK